MKIFCLSITKNANSRRQKGNGVAFRQALKKGDAGLNVALYADLNHLALPQIFKVIESARKQGNGPSKTWQSGLCFTLEKSARIHRAVKIHAKRVPYYHPAIVEIRLRLISLVYVQCTGNTETSTIKVLVSNQAVHQRKVPASSTRGDKLFRQLEIAVEKFLHTTGTRVHFHTNLHVWRQYLDLIRPMEEYDSLDRVTGMIILAPGQRV